VRRLLLTGYDEAMSPIGDLTAPLMCDYAERYHLDFECSRDYPPGRDPMWRKVALVERALTQYDLVLWLDADTIITNAEKAWGGATNGVHISRDWGADARACDFSTCNFVAFQDSLPLWRLILSHESSREFTPFHEQGAYRDFFAEHQWVRDMTHVHPRKHFNAVPNEIPGVVEPWESGDWLCHLTNLPNLERVGLFHEIMERTR